MDPSQKPNPHLAASLIGSLSSAVGHLLTYPLEAIKVRQQFNGGAVIPVARALFQEGGAASFYRGVTPEVARTAMNGVWVWPAMKRMLEWQKDNTSLPPAAQQAITGVAVGSATALITNPFEKLKIDLMTPGKPTLPLRERLSFRELFANGWQGLQANVVHHSVGYSVFLCSQKYFQKTTAPSPYQKLEIGAKVASCVTAASITLDVWKTHQMASKIPSPESAVKRSPAFFLRGIVPAFFSRLGRNTISANVMQWLGI